MKKLVSLFVSILFIFACNNSSTPNTSHDSVPVTVNGNVPDTTSGLGLPADTSKIDSTRY